MLKQKSRIPVQVDYAEARNEWQVEPRPQLHLLDSALGCRAWDLLRGCRVLGFRVIRGLGFRWFVERLKPGGKQNLEDRLAEPAESKT